METDQDQFPTKWIQKCLQILDDVDLPGTNWYVSESGMQALRKLRRNEELSEYQEIKLQQLQNEFRFFPPTDQEFLVLRGLFQFPPSEVTEIITNRPTSGSFLFNVGEEYIGQEQGGIMLITVPDGKRLIYHESLEQVIFPAESQFFLTGRGEREFLSNGVKRIYRTIYATLK